MRIEHNERTEALIMNFIEVIAKKKEPSNGADGRLKSFSMDDAEASKRIITQTKKFEN